MTAETSRNYGAVFESGSIDQVARKCARAAAVWGGLATVFCDRAGVIEVFAPGTIAEEREIARRPLDIVGRYDAPHQSDRRKQVRDLIARDIQHHLQERATI